MRQDHILFGRISRGAIRGRASSPAFDVGYYLNHHADLVKNLGAGNYSAALVHWLQFGINEGRQSAPDFDVRYYLDNNSDLKHEFGDDYAAAIDHWIEIGMREGRKAAP